MIRNEAHPTDRGSIRAALGAAVLAALASLPHGAQARDPGLNQPGRAGNVVAPAARAATPGVGAPGVGVRDPGINQPGAIGNRGVAGPGVGAPGVGVVDPGINQPGVAGNVGGVARRSVRL